MKKLIKLLIVSIFLLSGCSKNETDETDELDQPVKEFISDDSYIKYINPPPTSNPMHQYTTVTFHVSYNISSKLLPVSGSGFEIFNIVRKDNERNGEIWSRNKLRFRTDTIDFKFQTFPYPPKNKIVFLSSLIQMTDDKGGYVIVQSDSLVYNIIE